MKMYNSSPIQGRFGSHYLNGNSSAIVNLGFLPTQGLSMALYLSPSPQMQFPDSRTSSGASSRIPHWQVFSVFFSQRTFHCSENGNVDDCKHCTGEEKLESLPAYLFEMEMSCRATRPTMLFML